jgi:hypothetical protein
MAEFMIRNTLGKVADAGVLKPASLTKFGDLCTIPWQYNLLMQGKVFMGGMGLEATDIDGQDETFDEADISHILRAPESGTVLIPLYVRIQLTTEGGAAPDFYLSYVNTNSNTPISLTSGTANTVINCLGGQHDACNAKCYYTVVTAAITDAQNVVLWQNKDAPDDLLSVVAVDVDGGSVETMRNGVSAVTIPLFPHIPIGLNKGSMLALYASTATTDSKLRPTFVWAEMPDTIL